MDSLGDYRVPFDLSSVRAIWLDLDETLCDHANASREALVALRDMDDRWRAVSADDWCAGYARINKGMWEDLRAKRCSFEHIRVERFKRLIADLGIPGDAPSWMGATYLDLYVERTHWLPGAEEAVRMLRDRGYTLGIITDGNGWIQRRKIAWLGMDRFILHVVTPDETGCYKPFPGMYRFAADTVAANEAECLSVGDSWDYDVRGALDAGWRAVWVSSNGVAPEEYRDCVTRIDSVADLPALLP